MNFRYTSFVSLVAGTLLISACGGGGSSAPAVPAKTGQQPVSAGPTPLAPAVSATQGPLVQSKFVLTIPKTSTSSAALRKVLFVANTTQSASVVMTPSGGTPAPPAVMNVSASSPNCTASANALTCTLAVLAAAGSVVFTVTTYDQPNATGNVLATGTVSGTVIANQPNTFPVTLGGIPATLSLSLSNPYLPTGVSGATTLNVQAADADGNTIIGTYSTAVAFSGTHLSFAPTSVTQSGPVTVTFDGAATTVIAVKASAGAANASTPLTPTTNIVKYPIPSGTANPFQIIQGGDGNIYFGEFGPLVQLPTGQAGGTVPKIARLEPATGTITELPLGYNSPVGLYMTSDGSGWIAEEGNVGQGAIGRVTVSSGTLTEVPVPVPSSPPQQPRMIAQLGTSLYVTEAFGNTIAVVDPSTFGPGSVQSLTFANPSPAPGPPRGFQGIAAGSDGNLWVVESGIAAVGKVTSYTPGPATMVDYPIPQPSGAPGYKPAFIAAGSDGNLYVTAFGNGSTGVAAGILMRLSTSGTYSKVPLPTLSDVPYTIVPGPTGSLYFADYGIAGAIAKVTTAGQVSVWPVSSNPGNPTDVPSGVAAASDGSVWYTEAAPFGGINGTGYNVAENSIGHLILAAGWTVYPQSINIGIGANSAQDIGMAESGDSSPFTVTSLRTSVCTASALPGFSHNFLVTGVSPGTCPVTVTDKLGRTVTSSVTVTATSVTVQSQSRSAVLGRLGGFSR